MKKHNKNLQNSGCHKQGQGARKKSGKAIVNKDRDVALPAALNAVNITPAPIVKQSSKGTVVRHREFLDNVQGSAIYDVASYALNPGLSATFPWLFNIAKNYEKYRVRKLTVDLKTASGSQSAGTYGMAIDFNAADSAPNTEQQIMAFQGATNCSVWNSCKLLADKLNRQSAYRELFVRSGSVPSGEDIKTFDLGTLYVYTTGSTNDVLLGKVYLEYEIEFFTPQLGLFGDAFSTSASVSPIAPVRPAPFGTGSGRVINGGLDINFISGDEFNIPSGSYLCVYTITGTALTGNSPIITFVPVSGGQVVAGAAMGLQGTTGGTNWVIFEVYDNLTTVEWDFTSVMGSMTASFFGFAAYSVVSGSASKLNSKLTAEEVQRKTKLRRLQGALKTAGRLAKDSASLGEAAADPKNSVTADDGVSRSNKETNIQMSPYVYKNTSGARGEYCSPYGH